MLTLKATNKKFSLFRIEFYFKWSFSVEFLLMWLEFFCLGGRSWRGWVGNWSSNLYCYDRSRPSIWYSTLKRGGVSGFVAFHWFCMKFVWFCATNGEGCSIDLRKSWYVIYGCPPEAFPYIWTQSEPIFSDHSQFQKNTPSRQYYTIHQKPRLIKNHNGAAKNHNKSNQQIVIENLANPHFFQKLKKKIVSKYKARL